MYSQLLLSHCHHPVSSSCSLRHRTQVTPKKPPTSSPYPNPPPQWLNTVPQANSPHIQLHPKYPESTLFCVHNPTLLPGTRTNGGAPPPPPPTPRFLLNSKPRPVWVWLRLRRGAGVGYYENCVCAFGRMGGGGHAEFLLKGLMSFLVGAV